MVRLTLASLLDGDGTSSGGRLLAGALLALTLAWFFLSLTNRHGRSRWPLHALIGTGIFAVGAAVVTLALALGGAAPAGNPAAPGGPSPSVPPVPPSVAATTLWLALVGSLAGLLAAARAVIGMIREPGPRF